MKKLILLLGFIFAGRAVAAQAYIITYLKGNVYHDHKQLKLHDKVGDMDQIASNDKSAELALFSTQKGKYRLSFVNSKPVSTSQAKSKSELYQLVVGYYLMAYTTEKTLTTRGNFDLKAFFNTADTGRNGNNILIAEGELLPILARAKTFTPADKFFLCTVKGKDTISTLIHRNNSYLVFDAESVKSIFNPSGQQPESAVCFIRHGYLYNNIYKEEALSGSVNVAFLSKNYLNVMAGSFKEGLGSVYPDKSKLVADMESQLGFYFGGYFEPALRQVLMTALN